MKAFAHDGPGTAAETWRARTEWDAVPTAGLGEVDRVVVVGAHPDDETLGAGGLMATAFAAGVDVELVLCTAGEHSHPNSSTHTPDVLAARRTNEVRAALRELAPAAAITLGNIEDGQVAGHEQALVDLLVRVLGDGRRTLLVAPWRHDGHPDHDAAGRAAATAAHRTGASLWEYPIWWWHRSGPSEMPWSDLSRLALSAAAVDRKSRALLHHHTQTQPLSERPGDEALLSPGFLDHFSGGWECFFRQPTADDSLDQLHRGSTDPWQVDARHYERRKRALTLALLPRDRFARGLEVGCSVGALTEQLAERCDALVALDSSQAAVDAARRRLASTIGRVDVRRAEAPSNWPDGVFDLIVISEVAYFLSPRDLDGLVARVRAALAPDGVLLLCHWLHPVLGWPLDGARVHARFEDADLRPVQARYAERDFAALVLCADSAWTDFDA